MTETKKEIFFYQAECGDASRVRYFGNDGKYHNIFIDAGYRRTFKNVKNQLTYGLYRTYMMTILEELNNSLSRSKLGSPWTQ